MTKIIHLIAIGLLSLNVYAETLDAKPVKDLLSTIKATKFTYSETGMAFGFNTIKSCVYTSENMIVIKNYCSPKKDYPARGYTILSPKFGYIEFYEEDLTTVLKREVRIDGFPEIVAPYFQGSLKNKKLSELNKLLEMFNDKEDPACWSTNYSWYTDKADVNCYREDIVNFPEWAQESQAFVNDKEMWLQAIKDLETQFPKSLEPEE